MDPPEPQWTAGALLFSGRRDPTWQVTPEAAAHLLELWRRLPAARQVPAGRSTLGYRGCWLRSSEGARLLVREGVVVVERESAALPTAEGAFAREDGARAFERALLATAPPGSLPSGLPR